MKYLSRGFEMLVIFPLRRILKWSSASERNNRISQWMLILLIVSCAAGYVWAEWGNWLELSLALNFLLLLVVFFLGMALLFTSIMVSRWWDEQSMEATHEPE